MTSGTLVGPAIAVVVAAAILWAAIHVLPGYERGVVLRLGGIQQHHRVSGGRGAAPVPARRGRLTLSP